MDQVTSFLPNEYKIAKKGAAPPFLLILSCFGDSMQDRRSLNIENINRSSIGGKGMKNRRASVGFALGGNEASPNPSLGKKRDVATSGEKKAR